MIDGFILNEGVLLAHRVLRVEHLRESPVAAVAFREGQIVPPVDFNLLFQMRWRMEVFAGIAFAARLK